MSVVIFALIATSVSATEQEKDILILEGATYYTHELPPLKMALPGIPIPDFQMITTANWSGYRASWAVIDQQLYLIGVEGKLKSDGGSRVYGSGELFPGVKFPYKVTTFSETVTLDGRREDYVLRGNVLTYTDKMHIQFGKGKLTKITRETHRELVD